MRSTTIEIDGNKFQLCDNIKAQITFQQLIIQEGEEKLGSLLKFYLMFWSYLSASNTDFPWDFNEFIEHANNDPGCENEFNEWMDTVTKEKELLLLNRQKKHKKEADKKSSKN